MRTEQQIAKFSKKFQSKFEFDSRYKTRLRNISATVQLMVISFTSRLAGGEECNKFMIIECSPPTPDFKNQSHKKINPHIA